MVEANHPFSASPNEALLFSLKDSAGPEIDAPSNFARALKRARFARGWTQAMLAEELSITKRSIVSWETGARIPSVGMVVLLFDVLFPDEELSLHQELLCAYIVDDLEREARRKDRKPGPDDALFQRVQRVIGLVLHLAHRSKLAEPEPQHRLEDQAAYQREERELSQLQTKADNQQALEPLFALMAQLHEHPELIPVARDFIRELIPGGPLPG